MGWNEWHLFVMDGETLTSGWMDGWINTPMHDQYVHEKCLQKWCSEKGDTVCEICKETFKGNYHTTRPSLSRALAREESREVSAANAGLVAWVIQESLARAQEMPQENGRKKACMCCVWVSLGKPTIISCQIYVMTDSYSHHQCCFTMQMLFVVLVLVHTVLVSVMDSEGGVPAFAYITMYILRAVIFAIPFVLMGQLVAKWHRVRRAFPPPTRRRASVGIGFHEGNASV